MLNSRWNNPWKLTTIGLCLVGATALATGLVVANRTGSERDKAAAVDAGSGRTATRVVSSQSPSAAPAAQGLPAPTQALPTPTAIADCNHYAAIQAGQRDKTVDTVKDAGIGAIAGAALGAAGGAIAGGGRGAGKGAAIGGLVGAGGGTLYGLNENQKHDEHYRGAYASCMRSRGYTG